jgi:hypothetical protein
MQFVPDGPHVPDELIQQFEEGNGVLFCGAGVSKNAGLPLFGELVKRVYFTLGQPMEAGDHEEFDAGNFDRVLNLLEGRIEDRQVIRETVRDILTFAPGTPLPFHKALLDLSRTTEGDFRLVTTNFDTGFVMVGKNLQFETAPALPPARKKRWRWPVHLHGLLGADARTLEDLVLTSADFGDAYITSGWASRFVTELFARFTVVFVGYSLKDPVMRYLVDAIAISRSRQEVHNEVYAFIDAPVGNEVKVRRSWAAKGVMPIIYTHDSTHSRLVETAREWAELHRNGHTGRLAVVARYAHQSPVKPFAQDHRVSQMVWALRDPSGQAARKFAGLIPPPPVSWLEVFEEYGLLDLPAQASRQSWSDVRALPVNTISAALHGWLLAHLDKNDLIDRVIKSHGVLEPVFRLQVSQKIGEASNKISEPYRRFWELISNNSTVPLAFEYVHQSFEIIKALNGGTNDPLLFIQAFDQLNPLLKLGKNMFRELLTDDENAPQEVSDLVDLDVRLRAGNSTINLVCAISGHLPGNRELQLRTLVEISHRLLRVMDLFAAAGLASADYDPSVHLSQSLYDDSSVDLHSWTGLITLIRTAIRELTADKTTLAVFTDQWRQMPYPIFRRLAVMAMKESNALEPAEAAELLVREARTLLWPYYIHGVAVPLAAKLWASIPEGDALKLLDCIIQGPPGDLLAQYSTEDRQKFADRWKARFLIEFQKTERALPSIPEGWLEGFNEKFALETQNAPRPEFHSVVSNDSAILAEVSEYERQRVAEIADDVRRRIATRRAYDRLLQTWASRNQDRAQELAASFVSDQMWDEKAWASILRGLSTTKVMPESVVEIFRQLPRELLSKVGRVLTLWLSDLSEKSPPNDAFFSLWDRLIETVPMDMPGQPQDSFTFALNSPGGQLIQALVQAYLNNAPQVGSGLPFDVKQRLERALVAAQDGSMSVKVIIGVYLYTLHSVDRTWCRSKVLPLLDWNNASARDLWSGYVHNHDWSLDLLADLKPAFLGTLVHRGELGDSSKSPVSVFCGNCPLFSHWD